MDDQRLDKWLWCARFYKTRALATAAIKAGRISVNGQPAKPAKLLSIGDRLQLRLPPYEWTVDVRGVAKQRVGAADAHRLYEETPASIAARADLRARLKISAVIEDRREGKLTKKERREREALKRGPWSGA